MVVKIYVSTTSCDQEIKYRQQVVVQILTAKNIPFRTIDITDDENKDQKEFMQKNATLSGSTSLENQPLRALPPQIFNDDDYCGDYGQFEAANENNALDVFLKLQLEKEEEEEIHTSTAEFRVRGKIC